MTSLPIALNLFIFGCAALLPFSSTINAESLDKQADTVEQRLVGARRINKIIITGNTHLPATAILRYCTYKEGTLFDPRKTGAVIRSIYFGLKRFSTITIRGENISDTSINIHIVVQEKPIIKDFIFVGNRQIKEADLRKTLDLAEITALTEQELQGLCQKIKNEYTNKGYHLTTVESSLVLDTDKKGIATFTIHEGKKAAITRIKFKGNKHINSKELRTVVKSKERWLLSFMDNAGMFHPEMLDADKYFISRYYQNRGFLHAKVTRAETIMNDRTKEIALIYEIEEGERYVIKEVNAPGNDLLTQDQLRMRLPVRPGQYYSPERIADSMKVLERLWGNYGYIFAHIDPSIEPNDETKTVNISFYSDLGTKMTLNKVTVRGNRKTRDKIIRRKLVLKEGELLTQSAMDISKQNVESLGYFDPKEGINWKINRLNNDLADVDLILKEAKTGNGNIQFGFGGADFSSPTDGFTIKGNLSDSNLFGSGIFVNAQAAWSKKESTASFHLAQPWLMDRPISGALDIYHKRPSYDQLSHIPGAIHGKLTGGSATLGFITQSTYSFLSNTQILFTCGIDNITYEPQRITQEAEEREESLKPGSVTFPVQKPLTKEDMHPIARITGGTLQEHAAYQCILNNEFDTGSFFWIANGIEQDFRNHPIHTSRGHRWAVTTKIATPSFGNSIGFFKWTADGHWFTPLINEYDLVFHIHAFAGFIHAFSDKTVPFGELFHVGGPASVRGFLYSQIGPKFKGDSIGASRAVFWNAELIFPITADFNMKGVVFYDGGAGFGNPFTHCCIDPAKVPGALKDNTFDYRHSVGIGLRMLQPMPIKLDWGFKIDPRKGESASEVHFGMSYDW